MYKPGILIQPLHIWLEISAAQYVWKQKAFAAFNFLIIPRCDEGEDSAFAFQVSCNYCLLNAVKKLLPEAKYVHVLFVFWVFFNIF